MLPCQTDLQVITWGGRNTPKTNFIYINRGQPPVLERLCISILRDEAQLLSGRREQVQLDKLITQRPHGDRQTAEDWAHWDADDGCSMYYKTVKNSLSSLIISRSFKTLLFSLSD